MFCVCCFEPRESGFKKLTFDSLRGYIFWADSSPVLFITRAALGYGVSEIESPSFYPLLSPCAPVLGALWRRLGTIQYSEWVMHVPQQQHRQITSPYPLPHKSFITNIATLHLGDVSSVLVTVLMSKWNLITLFTVNSSHLHYNIFAPGCEAISGKKCKIARNCLTSKFKSIVMQMRKGNREKGYWAQTSGFNISILHSSTLWNSTCWTRLNTLLKDVGWCWFNTCS